MRLQKIFLFSWLFLCGAAVLQAAPSPWDSWRSGYTNFEQGEALRERGRYSDALEKFENARKSYLAVRAARPDWNQRVIADRLRDCDKQISDVRRLLGESGSDAADVKPEKEIRKPLPVSQQRAESRPVAKESNSRELFQAKAELERLRQQLDKQHNLEAEITALLRDRRVAEEKLALLEKRYQALQKQQKMPDAAVAYAEKRAVQEKMEAERSRQRYEAAEQQITELNGKLREAVLKANSAEKMYRRAEEELKRKNSELLQSREQLNKFVGRIKSPQRDDGAEKNDISQLDNLVNMLHNANEQLSRKEKQLALVREELQKEIDSGKVSAVELTNLREHNRRLESDIKLYSEKLKDLQSRLDRRSSDEFRAAAAAGETRSKLEKELLASQKELVALRGSIDSGRRELENAVRKNKSLEAEIISVRGSLMQKDQQLQQASALNGELQRIKTEFSKLQRNFKALSAENRENRLLAEAAKPREAELANAKLRLLEMDRLKGELAREQQISAELKSAYRKDQSELKSLRAKAVEFESSRRRLIELEAAAKETENLRKLEAELDRIKGREAELAAAKIKLNELENSLRRSQAAVVDAGNSIKTLEKNIELLKKENSELLKLKRVNEELKALAANQSSELNSLARSGKSMSPADESQKYRELAAKIGELNDLLQQQQSDHARKEERFARRIAKLTGEITGKNRMLELKEKELADAKKINAELADYRKNSVDALRDKVDLSRISRLEDELASLSRLNAELAAERDKLIAEAERKHGTKEGTVTLISKISPEQSASSGVIAESDGNFELAIWNYQQALTADPDFVPAHLRLGTILFRRGNYQDALVHLSTAFAADPADTALAKMIARCQIKLGRFGNARSVIEPLLIRQKNDAVVQMCAALIDAGTGKFSAAEERLHSAIRLAPSSAEIRLELARLLANSVTDRRSEAAVVYESARKLGSAPDPQLEKVLGNLLDHRREVMRFMSSAAAEAELGKDWNAATWYYKKLIAEQHSDFVPRLALAQWKSGNVSGAKETLEFHKPSREGMLVRALIALDEKDESGAMDAVRQAAGVKIDPAWVGVNSELSRVKDKVFKSAAVKALLQGIRE